MNQPKISQVRSFARTDFGTIPIEIQVALRPGLPSFQITGLPTQSTRESKDRIRMALESSGFGFPMESLVVQLSPSEVFKKSGHFDFPIAIAILVASGQYQGEIPSWAIGSLSLDGSLEESVNLVSLLWSFSREKEEETIWIPKPISEFALPKGSYKKILDLKELHFLPSSFFHSPKLPPVKPGGECHLHLTRQQLIGLEGLILGWIGNLPTLVLGNPGTGKSYLTRTFQTLLPPWEENEAWRETHLRFQFQGDLNLEEFWSRRPFRSPHHTSTEKSMVGGGSPPSPGEVTLASGGVLFLDEIMEFKETVLEALREPLEEKAIHLSRVRGKKKMPANFHLVACGNPCPCGNSFGNKSCSCSEKAIRSFRNKISGPFLDRIGIEIVLWENNDPKTESISTKELRNKIEKALEFRKTRDSNLPLEEIVELDLGFQPSIRKRKNWAKLCRVLADYQQSEKVTEEILMKSLQYMGISQIWKITSG